VIARTSRMFGGPDLRDHHVDLSEPITMDSGSRGAGDCSYMDYRPAESLQARAALETAATWITGRPSLCCVVWRTTGPWPPGQVLVVTVAVLKHLSAQSHVGN
jgi:hypothetical protein